MTHEAPPQGHELKKSMKSRHLVMMSLGSAIGAGLFVGSGEGIAIAGPAVLLSYVFAGIIVIFVMRMLGEMVAADPNPGAFSYYAGKAMGAPAAFAVGWLWWIQMCLVVAAEATAAAQIFNGLIPAVPQWVLALIFMLVFTVINLVNVRGFGEFEFWFSLIKVTFVFVFLALGIAFLFGLTPNPSPGFSNIAESGFMPNGWSGVAAALLVVAFAFGGVEIVAVAAAETADPERSVSKAIRTIVWRILVFYMGSVSIMILAVPWDDPELAASPFVTVLNVAGLPAVAAVMGGVIVVALLSSLNANLYGGSRMVFSLSDHHMAPKGIVRTNSRGVPVTAVLMTSAFGFVAVALNYFWAEEVLGILLNIVGSTLIITWAVTVVSHLILRRRAEKNGERLPLKMWAFPYLSWLTLAGIVVIVALGMTDAAVRVQMLSTFAVTAVLFVVGVVVAKYRTKDADALY